MLTRSHRSSSLSRVLFLLTLVAFLGATGCSTLPRQHWWQFWRKKPVQTASIYNPDQVTVPPPPDVSGMSPSGTAIAPGNNIPAPPSNIVDSDPLRRAPAGAVNELRMIYFNYDSDQLTPEATAILEANAQFLQSNPGMQIQIQGHCDERGTTEYNFSLGDRRARAVKAFLMSRGISADRLHTVSFGKDRPIDPNPTETAYAKNRRAQFMAY